MNPKTWFWTKIVLLLILGTSLTLVALPNNIKELFPQPVAQYLLQSDLKLGMDLEGGKKIEYKIDFSKSEAEVEKSLQDADPENDLEVITEARKKEIAEGVKETIQKRIDPNGTKEIKVLSAKRVNDYYISVQLTKDIDNPETLQSLEQDIDLQFKEPMTEEDKKLSAAADIDLIITAKKSFEDIKKKYEEENATIQKSLGDRPQPPTLTGKETEEESQKIFLDWQKKATEWQQQYTALISAVPSSPQYNQEEIKQSFGEEMANTLWTTKILDKVYIEPLPIKDETGKIVAYSLVLPKAKTTREKTIQKADKTFAEVQVTFPKSRKEPVSISDIPSDHYEKLSALQANGLSDVLEIGDNLVLLQKKPPEQGNPLSTFQEIALEKNAPDAQKKMEEAKASLTPKDQKITEEVLPMERIDYVQQWKSTGLGGMHFKNAVATQSQQSMPVVSIQFTSAGGKLFEQITGRLATHTGTVCKDGEKEGGQFAIFVGGKLISAPCVYEQLGSAAQITSGAGAEGNFLDTQKWAKDLAKDLNTGAIPAPISKVSEQKVSAELGKDAFDLAIWAGIIGVIALAVWMILFYRYFGFIAIFALGFYIVGIIFFLKYFSFLVLTLPGIAAIILSIGMAVDANILIFERTKEEIRSGKNFSSSVALGFERAWPSIRDSNISSLLTCLILYTIGTTFVKSFAINLGLGILISMITAIGVTRLLIYALTPLWVRNHPWLYLGGIKGKK